MVAKLEVLLAKPERFATAEALAKLGIGEPGKARSTPTRSGPTDVSAAIGRPRSSTAPKIPAATPPP